MNIQGSVQDIPNESVQWQKEMRQKWWAIWISLGGSFLVAVGIWMGLYQQTRLIDSQHKQLIGSQQHEWRRYLFDKRLDLCTTIANAALHIREAATLEDSKDDLATLDKARGQSMILLDGETNHLLEALVVRLKTKGFDRSEEDFKKHDDYQFLSASLIVTCRALQTQLVAATTPEELNAATMPKFTLEVIGPGTKGEKVSAGPIFKRTE